MHKEYDLSTDKISQQTDLEVFAERIKDGIFNIVHQLKQTVIPKVVKFFYKLVVSDVEIEEPSTEHSESEYTLKIVNASNHAKQASLLDLAVFTTPDFQDCLIEEKTLKEMVIEFQVIKSRLFIENRSQKGNFIYEGSMVEQVLKNLEAMSPSLKKLYIDFFDQEVYQYHCSSFLDISFEDLFDEKWLKKVCERLSEFNNEEILSSEYPTEILNKIRFTYMLIKVQEIKYESMIKIKSQS
jgi:hypothetical protein